MTQVLAVHDLFDRNAAVPVTCGCVQIMISASLGVLIFSRVLATHCLRCLYGDLNQLVTLPQRTVIGSTSWRAGAFSEPFSAYASLWNVCVKHCRFGSGVKRWKTRQETFFTHPPYLGRRVGSIQRPVEEISPEVVLST